MAVDEFNLNISLIMADGLTVKHYPCSITETLCACVTCREVVDSMVQHFKVTIFGDRRPVYDGKKSLYTANPLPVAPTGVSLKKTPTH